MTRKQKRLITIGTLGVVLAVAVGMILYALSGQISFFYSPSQAKEAALASGTSFRLGGLVKDGSWKKTGEESDFIVTDGETELSVHYVGLLPDLFREGQGIVADGTLGADGVFAANRVLAKHDENYMPKEVVEELKARGEWQRDGAGS
ncbi:cytochrome c maturation protein CcmE [Devosia sp.]|jgi:cytochrome c-type biogenesis protein CcmE|uniref:cytochrome c maturation protein CcmE n=1 Tax=Devosia sp. TaxID=1871048 RepID=UPI0037BFEE58